ncbi:hypothetical protein V490_00492 [Pseudogymnoascus sp. VKM F-3557]|nr:hypothetical protein V490_00492 [Pseudogymnoascus sp. VKM F-3557]
MNSLPSETICNIMGMMGIDDVEKFAATYGESYLKVRTDPVMYLGKVFRFAVTLLAAMTDTGSVFSGSFALEYFVPGSQGAGSDCDIYVPGNLQCVEKMMATLQVCGVKWDRRSPDFENMLRGERGTVIKISYRALNNIGDRLMSLQDEEGAAPGCVPDSTWEIIKLVRAIREKFDTTITAEDNDAYNPVLTVRKSTNNIDDITIDDLDVSILSADDDAESDTIYTHFTVINGSITHKDRTTKVQLIVNQYYGKPIRALQTITAFYASHVQCFISGWCAAHIFHDVAVEKEGIIWNTGVNPRATAAILKYKQRGYKFRKPDGAYKSTGQPITMGECPSKIVSFKDLYLDMSPEGTEQHISMNQLLDKASSYLKTCRVYEKKDGYVELNVLGDIKEHIECPDSGTLGDKPEFSVSDYVMCDSKEGDRVNRECQLSAKEVRDIHYDIILRGMFYGDEDSFVGPFIL